MTADPKILLVHEDSFHFHPGIQEKEKLERNAYLMRFLHDAHESGLFRVMVVCDRDPGECEEDIEQTNLSFFFGPDAGLDQSFLLEHVVLWSDLDFDEIEIAVSPLPETDLIMLLPEVSKTIHPDQTMEHDHFFFLIENMEPDAALNKALRNIKIISGELAMQEEIDREMLEALYEDPQEVWRKIANTDEVRKLANAFGQAAQDDWDDLHPQDAMLVTLQDIFLSAAKARHLSAFATDAEEDIADCIEHLHYQVKAANIDDAYPKIDPTTLLEDDEKHVLLKHSERAEQLWFGQALKPEHETLVANAVSAIKRIVAAEPTRPGLH